ncbi:MAG TPA: hypothetical protein DC009_06590 [Porphyromonadaceae bacterium]|nr:hypothetical protein [Porphyromonadaceae bacterium]
MNHTVVLSLGSNYGNREEAVASAIKLMSKVLTTAQSSTVYTTTPLSGIGEPYANAVIAGEWTGELADLKQFCKQTEVRFGRTDERRRLHQVPLDIDIVMYDGKVIRPADFGYAFFQTGYRQLFPNTQNPD